MNVTGDQVEVLGVNKLGDEYTVNLQPSKGICRVTLNFEHAPKGLTFQLSPWKERLEGFSVDGHDFLFAEPAKINHSISDGELRVSFTEKGLHDLKSGAVVQFVDFFL